jgi:hypothetical protein
MICVTDSTNTMCLVSPNACEEQQDLVIGTLTADTDYWIYIHNESTGRNYKVSATSDGDGLLTINMIPLAGILTSNNVYYLWVTEENVNITDQENITINAVEYTSFRLTFNRIWEDGVTIVPATQTIEIAA